MWIRIKNLLRIIIRGAAVGTLIGLITAIFRIVANQWIPQGLDRLTLVTAQDHAVKGALLFSGIFLLIRACSASLNRVGRGAVWIRAAAFISAALCASLLLLFWFLVYGFFTGDPEWTPVRTIARLAGAPGETLSLEYGLSFLTAHPPAGLVVIAAALITFAIIFFRRPAAGSPKTKPLEASRLERLISGTLIIILHLLIFAVLIDRDTAGPSPPNVVMIVIDTLRTDHLGCYGYTRPTSPHMDRFARDSSLFTSAMTVFPRTTPSAASIFTGLYPHSHGTRSLFMEGDSSIRESLACLPEILKNARYDTAAYIHHLLLHTQSGLPQGFSRYHFCWTDGQVTDNAIRYLRGRKDSDSPFFMLLWYNAPHWEYNPPREHLELFAAVPVQRLGRLLTRGQIPSERIFNRLYDDHEMSDLLAAYDGEIHAVDEEVGRMMASLRHHDLFEDTMIIVTSDHGESLGEHGYYFQHGDYYYDVCARIPLMIKQPGRRPGDMVGRQVRTIDFFPTILRTAGIEYPAEGADLFSPATGKAPGMTATDTEFAPSAETLYAFGENDYHDLKVNRRRYVPGIAGKWRIVRTMDSKLIFIPHPEAPIFEFYDLARDPMETMNLIDDPEHEAEIERLKKLLFDWIRIEDLENRETSSEDHIPEETKTKLRALGYM